MDLFWCRKSVLRHCSLRNSQFTKTRRELFTKGLHTIDNIPPTQGSLLEHLKRAVHQAAFLWSQALDPSPEHWGWQLTESGLKPLWTKLPEAVASCY